MAEEKMLRVILIGSTGSGKSTLGNRLLRRRVFIVGGGYDSVTREIQCEVGVFRGRGIEVCDTPGLNDGADAETSHQIVESATEKPLHGIIFVQSAAEIRLTKSMRKALRLVLRDLGGAASIEPRILFVFTRSTGLRTHPRAALSDALCRKFGTFCSLLPPIAFAGTLNPILDTLTAINPRFHNKVKQWLDSLLLLSDYIRPLPYNTRTRKMKKHPAHIFRGLSSTTLIFE